jgi:peptidyl-prolyl cis-trans isomerase SurA
MSRPRFFLIAVFVALCVSASAQVVVEEIIARVNDQVITRSDLQRNKDQVLRDLRDQGVADPVAEYKSRETDILRDLIDQQLLVQRAKALNINVEGELIKKLDEFRKSLNLETLEAVAEEAQKQGVSFEDFKNNQRNNLLIQALIQQEVSHKVQLKPEEVQKYYEEHKKEFEEPEAVHIGEILISTEPPMTTTAGPADPAAIKAAEEARLTAGLAKANDLLAKLRNGADFEETAKKESADPTASTGGDLGGFKRGQLGDVFESKVFNMKPGEITDPIRTKQGFVLLKLIEKQDAGVATLKQVEPQIQEALYEQQLHPVMREYLTKLREDAFINIKEGYVDSGASPNQTQFVYTTKDADDAKKKAATKKKKKLGVF